MYKVQSKSELRGTKGILSYHEEKEEDENTSILDESVISSVKKVMTQNATKTLHSYVSLFSLVKCY